MDYPELVKASFAILLQTCNMLHHILLTFFVIFHDAPVLTTYRKTEHDSVFIQNINPVKLFTWIYVPSYFSKNSNVMPLFSVVTKSNGLFYQGEIETGGKVNSFSQAGT